VNSKAYNDWIRELKEGDLILHLDNRGVYSSPVIFLYWNGPGRAHYLYIPDWTAENMWSHDDNPKKDQARELWDYSFKDLEKHGTKSRWFIASTILTDANKRFFPFPKRFLSKNQKKFIKLINKIKGYEY